MSLTKLKSTSPNRKLDTYASAAKEIEQEKQMVAALKRLSIGHLLNLDPDLPPLDPSGYPYSVDRGGYDDTAQPEDNSLVESYSSASSHNRYSYSELNFIDLHGREEEDQTEQGEPKDGDVSADIEENSTRAPSESLRHTRPPSFVSEEQPLDAELLWVPANMHPEINPQQYKMHVKTTIDELLEQKISRSLSRSKSKRSSLSFSVTDTDPDDSTVFVAEDEKEIQQDQPKKQYQNPSLRELTSELQAMTRLAGMDATDAVTLARTLSSASMGYSDVEKLAFDELGNPQNMEKSIYQAEVHEENQHQHSRRPLPKLRINTGSSSHKQPYGAAVPGSYEPSRPGGYAASGRQQKSPIDEEFSLRRSRRPDYRKGPVASPHASSQQLTAQQLGSQLQSSKAGKLAELRSSLLSSNLAQVPKQLRSQNFNIAQSSLPQQDPYYGKVRGQSRSHLSSRSTPGQYDIPLLTTRTKKSGSSHQTRHILTQSPYHQSPNSPISPAPLSPNDNMNFSPYPDAYSQKPVQSKQQNPRNNRSADGYRGHMSEGLGSQGHNGYRDHRDSEDRRNMKLRALSSSALYGYNPHVQNVPMRSSSDLFSSQGYPQSSKKPGRHLQQQFDQNGYPMYQTQQQSSTYSQHQNYQNYPSNMQSQHSKHAPQSYSQQYQPVSMDNRSRHRNYSVGHAREQQHQFQGHSQQRHHQPHYESHPQESYLNSVQNAHYHPQYKSQHQNNYRAPQESSRVVEKQQNNQQSKDYSVEQYTRENTFKAKEKRSELNDNLDLLRNEINEFKESLSRSEPSKQLSNDNLPLDEEISAEPSNDFSFDLTTHDVSYEDTLGIEKDIIGDLDESSSTLANEPDNSIQIPQERIQTNLRFSESSNTQPELSAIPSRENSSGRNEKKSQQPQSDSSRAEYPVGKYKDTAANIKEAKEVILSPIITPKDAEENNVTTLSAIKQKELVSDSIPHGKSSKTEEPVNKVSKQLKKKTSSSLLISKTDTEKKKTSKKPWPWSKDKSTSSEKESKIAEVSRKTVRSVSTPDLASKLDKSGHDEHSNTESGKDNVISKFFKKKRSHLSSGERATQELLRRVSSSDSSEIHNEQKSGQKSSRTSEESKTSNNSRDIPVSSSADVKSRIKQKLKNIKNKGSEKPEEPTIPEDPAEEEMSEAIDIENSKPLSTLEVQERLKKSIKRTSRANQPIEFTDSAFGFPLPPPSHSTLVMIDYRFPVHVERAIYRLSHLKLANPKRSLREQVLLSNFMYAYLNLVDHTLHLEQQMTEEEFPQPDTDMDLLGTHDIDTEFEADSLDEEDFDSVKLDLDVRETQISV